VAQAQEWPGVRTSWSEADDAILSKLNEDGNRALAIAREMGRTYSAITSRLAHLKRQQRLARLLDEQTFGAIGHRR
jgi:hypothetical protein